jgi:Mg2+-importing ATPase
VCNEAAVTAGEPTGGNALDQALWTPADQRTAAAADTWQKLGILPFDHERQLASVLAADPGGRRLVIVKGAPEVVLDRCMPVPGGARPALKALFSAGARVVAVATRRPAEGV